jgi:hypothetical protein
VSTFNRWAGPLIVSGGILWILVWFLFMNTHGWTQDNEQRYLLSLTWYDWNKLIPVSLLFLAGGISGFHSRQAQPTGRIGRVGFGLTVFGLVAAAVSTAAAYWFIPFGAYDPAPLRNLGELSAFFSMAVATVGLILSGIHHLIARTLGRWSFLPLVPAALAFTALPWLHMTSLGCLFGIGWIPLGLALCFGSNRSLADKSVPE